MSAIIFSIKRNARCIGPTLNDNPMPAVVTIACTLAFSLITTAHARAADCGSALLGQGPVVDVIDARTLRLADSREIRLAGIMPSPDAIAARDTLAALVANRDVMLRGDDDTPDRYGRQHAYVVRVDDGASVQVALLRAGAALNTGAVVAADCAAELTAAVAGRSGDGFPGHLVQLHLSRDCNRPELAAVAGREALVALNPAAEVITAKQDVAAKSVTLCRRANARNRAAARVTRPAKRKTVQPSLPGFDGDW